MNTNTTNPMFDQYIDRLFGAQKTEPDTDYKPERYKLGDHSRKPSIASSDLRDAARTVDGLDPDLQRLFNEAADRVSKAELHDFECPVCGQTHGHSDTKHDIRASPDKPDFPGFNVTEDFAESMEFHPMCHCGVNELAIIIEFFDDIERQVFKDEDDLSEEELEHRFEAIKSAAGSARIGEGVENRLTKIENALEERFDDEPEPSPSERGAPW